MAYKIPRSIHFMGIGGSGASGVAMIAKQHGFEVTGCDIAETTPYLNEVKKKGIPVQFGHDASHLKKTDLVIISPAIIFQNNQHPEYFGAKKMNKLKTWDEFLGQYLLQSKKTICIAGTHGKSTTTALCGLLFEDAGLDPNVLVGATVKEWKSGYRVGLGDIFIIESDEFYDKYQNYHPEYIVINNIEYDHPDYFSSEEDMYLSFSKFVNRLQGKRNLILNQDSPGIGKLLTLLDPAIRDKAYGYTLKRKPLFEVGNSLSGEVVSQSPQGTTFKVKSEKLHIDDVFAISLPGIYNVANTLGAIILSKLFDIPNDTIKKSLLGFGGISRRLEKIGETNNISVYDDYAHHPTAITLTIKAAKQRHPGSRLWVIDEPHSFCRTEALLDQYKEVFADADKVIITPVFKARDTEEFGVSGQSIVNIAKHPDIIYLPSFAEIVEKVKTESREGDVILVMGAGKSYQLARDILTALQNE